MSATAHKTVPLQITPFETIQVDEEIVPLVKWLNSLDGVRTLYSCQGDPSRIDEYHVSAYVTFQCGDMDALNNVLMFVQTYTNETKRIVGGEVGWNGEPEFTLRFGSNENLKSFMGWFRGRVGDG